MELALVSCYYLEDFQKGPATGLIQIVSQSLVLIGSANISRYTRSNIEVQGLELWLSGVGRPTGNARTERVIGTLKHEEIKLQDQYASELEARQRIGRMIWDYNFRRPNAGNGGFAPNSVHHIGRSVLMERRKAARKQTAFARRSFWKETAHE